MGRVWMSQTLSAQSPGGRQQEAVSFIQSSATPENLTSFSLKEEGGEKNEEVGEKEEECNEG